MMKHIAIIGAGPMGLMSAYELTKQGYQVSLFETDDRIGGMTASFDFDGLAIERFYHFVCATDHPTFALMKDLGIYDKLKWRNTKMGFYYQGKLYPWGDPFSLLKFPHLSFWQKLRYGLLVTYAKSIKNWHKLDKITVTAWLTKWLGKETYQKLWQPLFALKFDRYQNDLSAAWLGTRIKRVALSRKNMFTESLGYIEGGSKTLLDALEQAILKHGGKIHLNAKVEQIAVKNNKVNGVIVNNKLQAFDAVISTIPLPYVVDLVPTLAAATREKIAAIANVGVACVLFKLKHRLSENFWLNINDPTIAIPGLIEYTNLQHYPQHIVYAPYYMSQHHEKASWTDQQFIDEVMGYLKKINPEFSTQWVLSTHVARYRFAQTVCTPNFYSKLPSMTTSIKGFYMADTSFYYPEDRSIAESVQIGTKLAQLVIHDQHNIESKK